MTDTPNRVLVVTPHPNDSEFWCAGTVARWISEEPRFDTWYAPMGARARSTLPISAADLSAEREREQSRAVTELGVQELVTLGRPDGSLEDTDDLRKNW